MKQISKELYERLCQLVEKAADIVWLPTTSDRYYLDDGSTCFEAKLLFLSACRLYEELGLLDSVPELTVDECFDSETDTCLRLPDKSFDLTSLLSDDGGYSDYEMRVAMDGWSAILLPVIEAVGWSVDVEEVNPEDIGIGWCSFYGDRITLQNKKWRAFFRVYGKMPSRSGELVCKVENLDFAKFYLSWDDDDIGAARRGRMIHLTGCDGDTGAECGMSIIDPFFPAKVLCIEYQMWEEAKKHPRSKLLKIMEAGV